MNYEVPIDKSRFFLELVKFNEDTLIRNSFFPFLRNFIELNYNKGFVTINSPYLSGLIEILTNNSQNIFRSLPYTFFKIKTIKRNIIENFLSIGIGWLKHVRFIAFTNKKIKPYKKKKILVNLFSLEKKKIYSTKDKKSLSFLNFEINFLAFTNFVLLETSFFFLKYNPFITFWAIDFIRLVKSGKISKKNRTILVLQKINSILGLLINNYFFIKNLDSQKNISFKKTWNPDLYENCVDQKIYLNSNLISIKQCNKTSVRLLLGSNIFHSNFGIIYTGIEKSIKNLQKHLTPNHFLTIRSVEDKFCFIGRKKICLESYLNSFQFYLLNKLEIFEKKYRGFYFKFFFQFNVILPKFFISLNREFYILKTYRPLKKILNGFTQKFFSKTFFLVIKDILFYYYTRTNNEFLFNTMYLLTKKTNDKFSKIKLFLVLVKLYKKKIIISKEIIGGIFETFLNNFNKKKKINMVVNFFSNLMNSNEIYILKKTKTVLANFYYKYGFMNQVFYLLKKKLFFLLILKALFLKINTQSINLPLRKYLNQIIFSKKILLLIILAKLNKNSKYYELCFLIYPKFRALMKFCLGIILNEEYMFYHSKKQISIYISLKPNNKKGWFTLGFFSIKKDDFSTAIKSFSKVLIDEPENKFAKNNLQLCIIKSINFNQIGSNILEKLLKNIYISFRLILKIFYSFINKEKININFILHILLFLFRFKKKKIEENYIFLKGTVLFFTDFIRKKIKMFIYKKKK